MSRAAVKSKQRNRGRDRHLAAIHAKQARILAERAELDRWAATIEAHAALDAVLCRCDGCGLVVVAPDGPRPYTDEWTLHGCPVCGCQTGTYAGPIGGEEPGTPEM